MSQHRCSATGYPACPNRTGGSSASSKAARPTRIVDWSRCFASVLSPVPAAHALDRRIAGRRWRGWEMAVPPANCRPPPACCVNPQTHVHTAPPFRPASPCILWRHPASDRPRWATRRGVDRLSRGRLGGRGPGMTGVAVVEQAEAPFREGERVVDDHQRWVIAEPHRDIAATMVPCDTRLGDR